jgi:hypothetical protein
MMNDAFLWLALLAGAAFGALAALVWRARREQTLTVAMELLRSRLKTEEAASAEREQALSRAREQLQAVFGDLARDSLQSNSEVFLQFARERLARQQVDASQALKERETAIESLVQPIRDALAKIETVRDDGARAGPRWDFNILSRPRPEDVTIFTGDLALLLQTGARINDALELLSDDSDIGRLRPTVAKITAAILAGESFADALAHHPALFSPMYVVLARVGEASGTLVTQGHNLENTNACGLSGAGDLHNTNPKIGPLRDNGGPTWTHALLAGSPAQASTGKAPKPAKYQLSPSRTTPCRRTGSPSLILSQSPVTSMRIFRWPSCPFLNVLSFSLSSPVSSSTACLSSPLSTSASIATTSSSSAPISNPPAFHPRSGWLSRTKWKLASVPFPASFPLADPFALPSAISNGISTSSSIHPTPLRATMPTPSSISSPPDTSRRCARRCSKAATSAPPTQKLPPSSPS